MGQAWFLRLLLFFLLTCTRSSVQESVSTVSVARPSFMYLFRFSHLHTFQSAGICQQSLGCMASFHVPFLFFAHLRTLQCAGICQQSLGCQASFYVCRISLRVRRAL